MEKHEMTDKSLLSYLGFDHYAGTEYYSAIIRKLKDNNLYLCFGKLFSLTEEDKKDYDVAYTTNKMSSYLVQHEIKKIWFYLQKKQIVGVIFKGVVLANLLYTDCSTREYRDIDIWVNVNQFNDAIQQLLHIGYKYYFEDKSGNDRHHVVLEKGRFVVEVHHQFFNPSLDINESYLINHTKVETVNGTSIVTLSKTATFLHALYHLYMDYCWTANNTYAVVVMQQTKPVRKFLFRAYEIAAISEMCTEEIIWTDVFNDISEQQLRVRFMLMIEDISKIFPGFIPDEVLDMILAKQYIQVPEDILHRFIAEQYKFGESIDLPAAISRYVGEEWKKHGNACKLVNKWSRFSLFDDYIDVAISKVADPADPCKLVMTITVHDNELELSETDNFDFNLSDGIHLLLCGSQPYKYNSIFLFPKIQEDGHYYIVPYDCIEYKEMDTKQFPILELKKESNRYTIKVGFSHAFVQNNLGNGKFYFGLIAVKIDRIARKRNYAEDLISSSDKSQWFNPAFFHKIFIK